MIGVRGQNVTAGISSILLSTSKYYIHLIEGTRISVNQLYNKISKDSRHANCTILRYIDVRNREFGQWAAEHVAMTDFEVGGINLLSPTITVESDSITATQAIVMIRRIQAHLSVKSAR